MDIYFGCNKKIKEVENRKLMSYAKYLDLDVLYFSENLIDLKQRNNGESNFINTTDYEILFDGYIPGKIGLDLDEILKNIAGKIVRKNPVDYEECGGIWNICIREKRTGNIWLSSEPSAMLPLYYYFEGNKFYYCSHMHILASILELEPDYIGVTQKTVFGFTLGSRTYYNGIKRLNPGENVQYDMKLNSTTSNYGTVYYTEYKREPDIEEQIFNSLTFSYDRMKYSYDTIGLMLSEGFDSRFLGGIAASRGFKIKSYTHGIAGTWGEAITDKVAKLLNSDHHFESMIDGYNHTKTQLIIQLLLADNLNSPFWILASNYFGKNGVDFPIITGSSLDCTLGGDIFYKPTSPILSAVYQRYYEIFKQNLNALTDKYVEKLSTFLINETYIKNFNTINNNIMSVYNPDIANKLIKEVKFLNDHIKLELERIKITGSHLPSQQLQRYVLENRDRKLFFGSPLTIRKYNKIYIPSFEHKFRKVVSCVNPSHILHHKLYINILKKYLPDLLNIEIGAYGLAPKYPRMILETSRFYNKYKEKKLYKELLILNGKILLNQFRSATIFELCSRNENAINGFKLLIRDNNDIFNQSAMDDYLHNIKNYKIKTWRFEKIFRGLEACQAIKGNFIQ